MRRPFKIIFWRISKFSKILIDYQCFFFCLWFCNPSNQPTPSMRLVGTNNVHTKNLSWDLPMSPYVRLSVGWSVAGKLRWETFQKTLLWILFFFLVLQPKNIPSIAVWAQTGLRWQKRLRWHRHINAFFGLKTVVNQKSVNLGMISARHTTNRQSFKKVTCPFKGNPEYVINVYIQGRGVARLSYLP